MLKAILFDFNGIIADDEPLHLALFQKVLGEENIPLSREDYYGKNYLGMDDRDCFEAVLKAHGRDPGEDELKRLIERKARAYQESSTSHLRVFPGAAELVHRAAERYPLAIVSGALRPEIEMILAQAGLRSRFRVIVSAEDVREGKPSPEGFRKALREINAQSPSPGAGIQAVECLVIEDSPFGIAGARAAGMRCLAVTNSYPAERLKDADLTVSSLEGLGLEALEELFQPSDSPQTVLAYCPDLFFSAKISEAGRQLGVPVQVVSDSRRLETQARDLKPPLILIDLGGNGVDYPSLIQSLKQALPQARLVAYGSHVDKTLREEAQRAGCGQVLVRSEFVKALPELLVRKNFEEKG